MRQQPPARTPPHIQGCGALTHLARDCVERIQRRWPAGFTRRAVRRDERQVLRGDDGGACSRDDASKLDFCAGYEPAARMELAAAHGAEAMRADAAVCMLNLDVDLALHDPKTRSVHEDPRPV